jgi:ribosome-associated protein
MQVDVDEITQHLLTRASWSASRSSGPGGQHRDKASTRAELTLDATSVGGLEAGVAVRILAGLGQEEGPLRISVQDERSLARNQEIAVSRLQQRVAEALAEPPPPRRATRPSRSARRARLEGKTRRGQIKRLRQPPSD